ncbi:hypothetical protein V8C44DRAFT_359322 [Trichoderma aethiopicum]
MPTNFVIVIQDLEDLLCHHITASGPEDFVDELVDILKAVLGLSRNTHWSVESFLYDLREEYHRLHFTHEPPKPTRPSNDIWPRLNRSVIEPLSTMPMTHDIREDMTTFAIRYADQLYNVLRLQAKLPYKPFIDFLTEPGSAKGSSLSSALTGTDARSVENKSDEAPMHDCAPLGAGSGSQHAQEHDAGLLLRVSFLEDRVLILERREEQLDGQLDRAEQAMAALRSTNLDLARKVSEVQQRNHDLRRTYAV